MRLTIQLLLTLSLIPAPLARAGSLTPKQQSSISPSLQAQLTQDPSGSEYNVLVCFEAVNGSKSEVSALAASAKTLRERYDQVDARLKSAALPLRSLPQSARVIRRYWIANVADMRLDRDALLEIAERGDVRMIYPNVSIEAFEPTASADAVATSAGAAANLQSVGARALWARGLTGQGRLVASIDTGVEGIHPALNDRWRGADGDTSASWFDPLGGRIPNDVSGHGTHVMGIMVGRDGADTIGLAPDAEWISAAVVDRGRSLAATFSDILAALEWVTNPDGNSATMEDVPDVVCNSWGVSQQIISPCDELFFEAIDNVEAMGVVCIFAAGNEGPNAMSIRNPADRGTSPTASFSVGAVDAGDPDLRIPSFSSRGPSACDASSKKPEIVAPGVAIRSSYKGQTYRVMNGTSMSAPHVAAAVALLRQYNPELTPEEIKHALLSTAHDVGEPGEDNASGSGMIDLAAAVDALPSTLYPQISVGNPSFDLSGDGVPVPGETVDLIVSLNIQSIDAANITLHLTSLTGDVTVRSDAAYVGTIPAGTSADNANAPFSFEVAHASPLGGTAQFEVRVTGDSRLAWWRDTITVVIGLPQGAALSTVSDGAVALTVGNFGHLGLGDRSCTDAGGQGWRSSMLDANILYEGALMLSAADGGWSDASRRAGGITRFDFVPQPGTSSGAIAYDDSRSETPLGLLIEQPPIRIITSAASDVVIVSWTLRNLRGTSVPGLQAGWLFDIDAPAAGATEEQVARDQGSGGFLHLAASAGFVAGIVPLAGAFAHLSFFENIGWTKHAPSLSEKRAAFDGSLEPGETVGDWFTIATTSPADLAAGDSLTFALALISARSSSQFAEAASEARRQWATVADADEEEGTVSRPTNYLLGQNYPNPFNSTTIIPITVAGDVASPVRLDVFDLLGRRVRTLVDGSLEPGTHPIVWDGTSSRGGVVPSGVYFSRLVIGGRPQQVRQMVHLK